VKTRKGLLLVVGILLAIGVAVHYARRQWNAPGHATGSAAQETCGRVANVYHDTRGEGRPTFVDLGPDYPNQDFTVLIWQSDLGRFSPPPESWLGKTICVTGPIKLYKGRREIIAYRPTQIRIRK